VSKRSIVSIALTQVILDNIKPKVANPKRKGNAYENKLAKDLSIWIFGDYQFMRRTELSGASKIVYAGDIAPIKLLPTEWNNTFPFLIEAKSGYKNNIPDFWCYSILETWMKKCIAESNQYPKQKIIWLITQFLNKSALLSTNHMLGNLPYKVAWCVPNTNSQYIPIYTYVLKDVMKYSFHTLYNVKELI